MYRALLCFRKTLRPVRSELPGGNVPNSFRLAERTAATTCELIVASRSRLTSDRNSSTIGGDNACVTKIACYPEFPDEISRHSLLLSQNVLRLASRLGRENTMWRVPHPFHHPFPLSPHAPHRLARQTHTMPGESESNCNITKVEAEGKEVVAAATGAAAGATVGATIGTVFLPVVGTAVGGAIGAVVGLFANTK